VIHIAVTKADRRSSTVCVEHLHALCTAFQWTSLVSQHVSACLVRLRCRQAGSPWP